jgi:pimeloyl-ACP methyl ester carboxylesterase
MSGVNNSAGGSLNLPADSGIESREVKVDGRVAHYLKAGSGPPVVMLHGGASDCRDWIETMQALQHSYTLYAPDIVGYGKSDSSRREFYLSDFVDFIRGFVRELGVDSQHVLVGHSIGGRICLEIALRQPDLVRRLVLIDTVGFGKLARWGLSLGAIIWGFREALGKTQPYPRFRKRDGEDKDWICLNELSSLRVPTLLVWNSRDPYYPVSGALRARELIPEVRLEIFRGYGHAPHVKKRERFNRLLLEYLSQS